MLLFALYLSMTHGEKEGMSWPVILTFKLFKISPRYFFDFIYITPSFVSKYMGAIFSSSSVMK